MITWHTLIAGYAATFNWSAFGSGRNPAVERSIALGQMTFLHMFEFCHFLVAGHTGSGKTQAIQQILLTAHARGDRAGMGQTCHSRIYGF
jgi:hypothetical protein